MSCHLLPCIRLNDVFGVRDYLFPELKDAAVNCKQAEETSKDETPTSDGWDEDWGDWNDDKQEESRETTPEEETEGEGNNGWKKWMQECIISVSPAADLIALANEDRLVLMTPKFDGDSGQDDDTSYYSTVWSGSVAQDAGENITALLSLPLASQKRSTQGAPDWTCVLVGFNTGFVRMYTETGALLLSQKLHTGGVLKLKCNTYTPRRYLGIAEQHEELLILYTRALVTIDGFSLYQALKACRNQVARATASGEASLQPPPLAYKKWAPQDMDSIVDCHTTGVHSPNPFDQMVLASLTSHTSTIRPSPPAASVYLMSGMGPYLGFFYAIEGSTQPILSEVAFAVASKLKSAIMSAASGWLSFGSKNRPEVSAEKPTKIEPATPLNLRFGLPDMRREGLSVSLSPNNTYAATTDSFGRIMLIDTDRGIALRMWKGYRDAQIGWVEVREDEGTGHNKQGRSAQFLVIYAARRGILEVWVAGNGPRIAAFNVSKHCKLVHLTYGILGLNNVTCRGVRIKAFQVGLMDAEGVLKAVQVPFHLALSDKNNKRVRDMHLLKKLKQVLKENTEESESLDTQVRDLLLNIKISSIAQQGVDRVLSTRYLSAKFMIGILKACVQRLLVMGEEHLDIERRLFMQYCHLQEHLIESYIEIEQLQCNTPPIHLDSQSLSLLLGLSESEVEHIVSEVEHSQRIVHADQPPGRVRFECDTVSHVSGFLGCFTCSPHVAETEGTQQGGGTITLVRDLPEEKKLQMGAFLYECCFKYQSSPGDLGAVLRKSNIPMEQLAQLLVWTWINDSTRSIDGIPGLFNLLKIFTASIDQSRIVVEKTSESPWWQSIRDLCTHSCHCQSAFLAAIVSRSVAMEMSGTMPKRRGTLDTTAKDPDADTISVTSETLSPIVDTEPVPLDIELWSTVVRQLEDLICIDSLLRLKPTKLRRVPSSDELTVSISTLLEGGKGCITEVIARHVSRVGFQPEDLYRPRQDETSMSEEIQASSSSSSSQDIVWDQVDMLRKRFPHSMENDVLFSNSCWEYTVIWNKLPEEVDNLKSALDFLRLVQNAMLRQGVCSMMWHMFLSKKFHAAAHLMEKVGKFPKDRLCRKDIGIGETRLPQFVSCICDFFNIIMEANCETNEVPVFNIEPLWNTVKGTVSLVELAIDQKATNYGLLKLHHQLAVVINAVITFNIKPIKVLSLFDSKGKHGLFQDLHAHPLLPTQNVDTSIGTQRRQFLTRIVSLSVMKMRDLVSMTTDAESASATNTSRLRTTEAGRWPETVLQLAEEFGVDLDLIKRHHVCTLYSAGFDKLAEEVLLTVNDRDSLGQDLLTIVGQRVAQKLSKLDAQMVVELMSNVNPALSTWLKSMNSALLVYPDVPCSDIQALVTQTLNQLSENHPQQELAASLVELVQVLG
ncbi:rab3 GTPase-activating protein non-catalytic subunit-like [Mercenaria mercenaria]|uniref:rab3 GTPase-activating protein non-catalytic subunit-like n=1 Tax=Mercenaria mercenaria TaxID=6596 RepID=UPI00234F1665|nr:rab3 GTPase-activating protein non-catalytic subunit-like [Mercenaria mercenaria]